MQLTLFLFGREVLSFALEIPEPPNFSDVSSAFAIARPEEPATSMDEWEEEDEEGQSRPRIGFRQQADR